MRVVHYLGSIVVPNADGKDNSTTAAPFVLSAAAQAVRVQPDRNVYLAAKTATFTPTAAAGLLVLADDFVDLPTGGTALFVGARNDSGAQATVKVFALRGRTS